MTMEVELLSAAERDSIVATYLRPQLEPLGLSEVAPRRWIDGSTAPSRRLFELTLLKGAGMMACWGFSLDFVPHISAGRIRWHRSNKTARLDVLVCPKILRHASFLFGARRLAADLIWMLPEAVAGAQWDWESGATFEGMLEIIKRIRDRHTNFWEYGNLTQIELAFAFLSAKVGDLIPAERELENYLTRCRLDEAEGAKLRCLLQEAATLAGPDTRPKSAS